MLAIAGQTAWSDWAEIFRGTLEYNGLKKLDFFLKST